MANYAVLHLQKNKTGGHTSGLSAHIRREFTPKNSIPELTPNNRLLIGEDLPLDQIIKKEIEDRYNYKTKTGKLRQIRSDANLSFNIVLSATPDYFYDPGTDITRTDKNKLDQWVEASIKYLKDTHGNNLVSATLHVDEKTPHIHATVIPFCEKNEMTTISAKEYFTPETLNQAHDDYAVYMQPLGILRGEVGSIEAKAKQKSDNLYYLKKANEEQEIRGQELYKENEEIELENQALVEDNYNLEGENRIKKQMLDDYRMSLRKLNPIFPTMECLN